MSAPDLAAFSIHLVISLTLSVIECGMWGCIVQSFTDTYPFLLSGHLLTSMNLNYDFEDIGFISAPSTKHSHLPAHRLYRLPVFHDQLDLLKFPAIA